MSNLTELTITTADGVGNRLTLYRNPENVKAPIILCMPAMGVRADYYQALAQALCDSGLNAATADLRGIGASSVRASRRVNFGYGEMLQQEWPAMLNSLREIFPENPVYLLGHSLGGQLNTLFLADNADQVDGMILIAACNIHFKGFHRPLRTLLATQFLFLVSQVMGYLPGKQLGFGGREARQLIKEWAHCARTGHYKLKSHDDTLEEKLAEVRLPVMAISFEEDWMAPRQAVIKLYDKLATADITHQHLDGKALGIERLNHFNWAKEPAHLVQRIRAWLEHQSGVVLPDRS
ncbi:alpha/beta fold hydrolase [Aestuariirhabdus sp. Z084]|uniref:alpha/beta hydrolase family protein n=1 Tax=Aestuariirhabdus haliotis TaxID=2918751 RepID=UPI00201B3526|nr:alpha/beta fold hydrolase [Aestuariirhabdus haliotis]MCL6416774.1 alpha/beta fold hydrolase [Aestuariirhabdus haliotis]MCL6420761.1 alpha/beta fold hydrolase [Aestuariirhabdus haliotis]